MGCLELLPQVSELIEDRREEVAYEAAWTCALRGHHERAAEKLWQVVRTGSRQAARAAAVAARVSRCNKPQSACNAWVTAHHYGAQPYSEPPHWAAPCSSIG